jgi:hypothetical protein
MTPGESSRTLEVINRTPSIDVRSGLPAGPRSFSRSIPTLLTAAVLVLAAARVTQADWRDEIGLTNLQRRLGSAMPTGGNMPVTQVEMSTDSTGDYLPDPMDVLLTGRTINRLSGDGGVSGHATTVARYLVGLGSEAGGIRSIDTYEANSWAGRGFLRMNSASEPPTEVRRIQNHSWIGSFDNDAFDSDVLRRVDLLVERDGVLVTAGVNNGTATPLPKLMCSAYNVVSIGLTSARSSFGPTRIENAGRVKPDLVAPMTATSWATPVVASCSSLLLQAIDAGKYLRPAGAAQQKSARPLLCKALLMGGATKTEWPDWRKGFAAPCLDGSVPLDYRYGAGELNIDNSFRILTAGQHRAGSADAGLTGWDYAPITAGGTNRYFIQAPPAPRGCTASILVTWNRKIVVARQSTLRLTPVLADIDLRLYTAGGTAGRLVDASTSRVDNVEHIYLTSLAAGRYVLEVSSDKAANYCLTWDVQPIKVQDAPILASSADATPVAPAPVRIEPAAANPSAGAVVSKAITAAPLLP